MNITKIESAHSRPARAANPKQVGETSEAMVIAALVRAGKKVFLPFGDNQRSDLVIEEGETFIRVQVKTGRIYKGAIEFPTRSSYAHRGRGRRHYRGDVDLFAVYAPALDKVYLIPVDSVGTESARLRIEPPKNGQKSGVRWAKDFELLPPPLDLDNI